MSVLTYTYIHTLCQIFSPLETYPPLVPVLMMCNKIHATPLSHPYSVKTHQTSRSPNP